jgi:hypothetical protein
MATRCMVLSPAVLPCTSWHTSLQSLHCLIVVVRNTCSLRLTTGAAESRRARALRLRRRLLAKDNLTAGLRGRLRN